MPPPWFCHACARPGDRQIVDGFLCYPDDREFDVGEERPFLAHPHGQMLRPPPPEYRWGRFDKAFGIHSPVCGGRCLVASCNANNSLWITVLLLLVPAATWAITVVPELESEFGWWPVVVTLVFLGLSLSFLTVTWLVEPGILPHVELEDRSNPSQPVRLIYVFLHGQYFLKQTFRAQNSRFTDSCIEGFDHYCPYVGNAVGKRNYRYFILFLTNCLLLCISVTASAVALVYERIANHNQSFWHSVKKSAGATVLAGFCLVMGLSIACLLGYHLKLICRGLSTYEDLKVKFPNGVNPHDQGWRRNCFVLWCGPHYPSRVVEDKAKLSLTNFSSSSRVAGEDNLAAPLLSRSSPAGSGPPQDILALNESLLFSPSTPVFPRTSPRHNTTAPGGLTGASSTGRGAVSSADGNRQ